MSAQTFLVPMTDETLLRNYLINAFELRRKAPPNTSPRFPLKVPRRHKFRRFLPHRLMTKRRRQQRITDPLKILGKSSEDGRLSPGKAGIQTAAPRGREIALRAPSRR
jgi:hypothetical protein